MRRPAVLPTEDMQHLIYIMLPAAIEPEDREDRFANAIDAELTLAKLGFVSGGGTLIGPPEYGEDEGKIISCGIDVDTNDVAATRTLLRAELPELECPIGTCIMFNAGEDQLQDRFTGSGWVLDEPAPVEDDE